MAPKRIGVIIKRLGDDNGLTQQGARKVGVTDAYTAMLETGMRKNPTSATLRRWAKALKVPVADLLR